MGAFVRNIFFGVIIGLTFIVPGMSGSTMAVMLGIYDEIIENISGMLKNLKSLLFLVPLGIGAVMGAYSFAGVVKWALSEHVLATNFLFIGLMVGSVPLIYAYATRGAQNLSDKEARERISTPSLVAFLGALALMVALLFVSPDEATQASQDALTLSFIIKLFAVSFIACATMVIPGISGALMFVIFGVYGALMTAVYTLDFAVLLPAVAGAFVGLLVGARIINILLKRWELSTYWGILGLVAGSIIGLLYNNVAHIGLNAQLFAALVTLAVGTSIGGVFGYFAMRKADTPEG